MLGNSSHNGCSGVLPVLLQLVRVLQCLCLLSIPYDRITHSHRNRMVCPHPRQSMCGAGVLTPRLSRVKPWIAAVPPRQAASQHQQIRRGWSRRTARCRADAASTEARQRAARALLRDIATAAPCPERWPELAAEGVHLFQPPITAPPSWHKLQRELQGRPVVDTLRAQLSDEQVPAARTHGPLGE